MEGESGTGDGLFAAVGATPVPACVGTGSPVSRSVHATPAKRSTTATERSGYGLRFIRRDHDDAGKGPPDCRPAGAK